MRAVPLCLALLLASGARPQARMSWRVGEVEEAHAEAEPPTIAAIALSIKSRAIQDSRCYLMNGGAVESFFISEDTPVGSVIGTLSVNGEPDEEQGDITLRLQERDAAVGIAPGSKNITLLRALDREEKSGPSNVYVNVRCDRRRTTDPSFIIPVSVRVWDVNDNAPAWVGAPYRARLSELAAVGSRVPLAPRAADADQPGPHATVRYAVLPGPHSEYFSFPNELEGTLVIKKPLDYESQPNLTVTLRAQDGGSPPLHNDTTLTVQLLDADDQNPQFAREHYTALLPDDAKEGTVLAVSPEPILALDQDKAINAPVQYSVVGAAAALLALDKDTGRLAATDQLVQQLDQPLTIVIKATQVDNSDRYALATLTVSRRAAAASSSPAAPVRFRQRQYDVSVSEAAAPGTVLLTLHTDPPHLPTDESELQFYVSERGFLEKFGIDGGGRLLLRRPLDFEAQRHYHYQVMVTDGRANDTASINITVEDVNEWEPRFRYPQYEFRLNEEDAADTGDLLPVGRLEVFDGDKQDTLTITLSGPDARWLHVNESGFVFVRSAALASLNSSALRAMATAADDGHPPKQTSVPLSVVVNGAVRGAGGLATPLFAAALAALALLVCALLCYVYTVRKRSKQPASANKGGGYATHEKPRSPRVAPAPAPPPQAEASLRPAQSSASLLSVSAGASTILADSSSSLELRHDAPPGAGVGAGAASARQSQRAARGRVAPAAGPALMSDHLRGAEPSRSGVAWPAATIPASLKRLSWDAQRQHEDSVLEGEVTDATNRAVQDHMNLTVYF